MPLLLADDANVPSAHACLPLTPLAEAKPGSTPRQTVMARRRLEPRPCGAGAVAAYGQDMAHAARAGATITAALHVGQLGASQLLSHLRMHAR